MADNDDTIAKIMARSGATKEDASLALNQSGGDANKALMSLLNQSATSFTSAGVTTQNSFKTTDSQGSKSKSVRRNMADDDDDAIGRPGVPQREYAQGALAPKQNNNVNSEPDGKYSPAKTGISSSTKGLGPSSPASTSQNDPPAPGAVGVDGPRIGIDSNPIDISRSAKPPASLPFGNSMSTPVEAQVVHDNQEEFESLQEQVQRQQRELDEIRRTHQTVVVGELMTDDEEAQYTNASKDESPPGVADASTSKDSAPETTKPSRSSDVSKKKWILIGVGVLAVVIIAIVLAVVLSEDKGSTSTDECATETEALQNTAQIQNANAAWNAEFASLTNESAVCNIIDNSGTCTFDSKSLSSHEDYLSACTQVGGSPQTYSDSFSCSFMRNGENFQIEYQFVDIPQCIAFSCDQAAGQASVSELVAAYGNRFDCS